MSMFVPPESTEKFNCELLPGLDSPRSVSSRRSTCHRRLQVEYRARSVRPKTDVTSRDDEGRGRWSRWEWHHRQHWRRVDPRCRSWSRKEERKQRLPSRAMTGAATRKKLSRVGATPPAASVSVLTCMSTARHKLPARGAAMVRVLRIERLAFVERAAPPNCRVLLVLSQEKLALFSVSCPEVAAKGTEPCVKPPTAGPTSRGT